MDGGRLLGGADGWPHRRGADIAVPEAGPLLTAVDARQRVCHGCAADGPVKRGHRLDWLHPQRVLPGAHLPDRCVAWWHRCRCSACLRATSLPCLPVARHMPAAVALAESYTPVHGADATIFVVGAASGEALLPFIISSLFESASGGPSAFMWVVGIASITNLANYYLMRHVGRKYAADTAAAGLAPATH